MSTSSELTVGFQGLIHDQVPIIGTSPDAPSGKTSTTKGPFPANPETGLQGYSGVFPVYFLGPYDAFDDTESYCILTPNLQTT